MEHDSENAIHVWSGRLDQAGDLASLNAILSPLERSRAEQFRLDIDRRRFIVSRGLLRTILGRYLERDPQDIHFIYGDHGKPAVAELHFNLSHCGDLMVCAVSRTAPVGIDIERIADKPDLEQIANAFFSAREAEEVRHAPAHLRTRAFLTVWTRKEAYLKATGQGIAEAVDDVEVALDQPPRLVAIHGSEQEAAGWSLHDLEMADYVGALAVKGQAGEIRNFRAT